jgi:hypothetical protein
MDSDGTYDEIAFQIDLAPHQTRTVTIAYCEWPPCCACVLTTPSALTPGSPRGTKGQVGSSKRRRGASISISGTPPISMASAGSYLELFASPEYVYHTEGPFGRDIYGIGKALGVRGVGRSGGWQSRANGGRRGPQVAGHQALGRCDPCWSITITTSVGLMQVTGLPGGRRHAGLWRLLLNRIASPAKSALVARAYGLRCKQSIRRSYQPSEPRP